MMNVVLCNGDTPTLNGCNQEHNIIGMCQIKHAKEACVEIYPTIIFNSHTDDLWYIYKNMGHQRDDVEIGILIAIKKMKTTNTIRWMKYTISKKIEEGLRERIWSKFTTKKLDK